MHVDSRVPEDPPGVGRDKSRARLEGRSHVARALEQAGADHGIVVLAPAKYAEVGRPERHGVAREMEPIAGDREEGLLLADVYPSGRAGRTVEVHEDLSPDAIHMHVG